MPRPVELLKNNVNALSSMQSQKLQKLSNNVYVVPGRTNAGVLIVDDNECVVIDTGIDEDSGRRIFNAVKSLNLKIRAIVNTHHHADHIGGNALIVKRSGATVYATPEDKPFIERPVLEPLYLFGSFPPKLLRTKLLEAEGVPVRDLDDLRREVGFEAMPLPGHTMGMVGISYGNVLFTADAFFPVDIIQKYGAPYHLNVKSALESLRKLLEVVGKFEYVVPAHGNVLRPPEAISVINENLNAINRLRDFVLNNISDSVMLEELIMKIFSSLGISIDSPHNYLLNRSALLSYIAWLSDDGLLTINAVGNKLLVSRLKA
ncbi:beta-lactamase domain protein [Vulcanisaeta moutnovskia 768-28]|uniref:Beta-lactamase domain protein n=1 Tax=Vulcanisaeta moutnovskia (strain 768-28) TaxID=985053 RepID=F0QVQ6_VULM7|nr:MBL fold metallo-hydrolase [Vulcanisaeta moutnovskia]ADY02080.1 beta-lactamase domain protein [Vulcanisaeta moutnovskia 768-28]